MVLKNIPLHNIDLEHVFLNVADYIAENLNVAQVGTIQSFNSENQTAVVSLNTKRLISNNPDQWENYSLLADVPVIVLGGGGSAITFPIQQNDECLVIFNNRELDNWFQNGGTQAFTTPRVHDLSDGIAIVGLRSLPNVLQNYNAPNLELRNDATKISISVTNIDLVSLTTRVNGIDTLSGTFSFQTTLPGFVSSMTFVNGLLTGVTLS